MATMTGDDDDDDDDDDNDWFFPFFCSIITQAESPVFCTKVVVHCGSFKLPKGFLATDWLVG